jgi:hypothetical protein
MVKEEGGGMRFESEPCFLMKMPPSLHRWVFGALLATPCLVLCSGCATPRAKFEQAERTNRSLNRLGALVGNGALAISRDDPAPIEQALQAAAAEAGQDAATAAAAIDRIKRMENEWKTYLSASASILGVVSPTAASIAFKAGEMVKAAQTVADEAGRRAQAAEAEAVRQKAKAAELEQKMAAAEAAAKASESRVKELATDLKAAQGGFLARFEKLDDVTKQRAKDEILAEIQRQKLVSEPELAKLREKSPEELAGLLGGGGAIGLAALLALLRSFGASRGQKEIDEQWEQLKAIENKMGRLEEARAEDKRLRDDLQRLAIPRGKA